MENLRTEISKTLNRFGHSDIKKENDIFDFLQLAIQDYNSLSVIKKVSMPVFDDNGKLVLQKGSLVHFAKNPSLEVLKSISEKGVVSGDFVGKPESENDESYFCADFYRSLGENFQDFSSRIKEGDFAKRSSFGLGKSKFSQPSKNIGFIFDNNSNLSSFTKKDMYLSENSENVMQNCLNLLDRYKFNGEKSGQIAAIPYGIPSGLITGIIAGKNWLTSAENFKILQTLFPTCYIVDRNGSLFYSPYLSEDENKTNQELSLQLIKEQDGNLDNGQVLPSSEMGEVLNGILENKVKEDTKIEETKNFATIVENTSSVDELES